MTISIKDHAGSFAENKDVAARLRKEDISPALSRGESVTLDFTGVDAATQSFVHALISEVLRENGIDVLDRLEFKSCNTKVRKIIEIVVDYMQEGL